ncbi:MAG TPA: hypothetical protein VI540_07555 [Gaiellaceae bacterium]|nr:hypothetical protein [Gaiellaceae bacterium]
MTTMASMLAVSEFWGGDGDTWLAILAVVLFILLPLLALYHARTFIKKL